jgi:hypothetical protein
MRNMACMLHSTYFGVLQALRKEKGLFAICELSIKGIDEMLKAYFNFLEDKSVPEIIAQLESTGIYQNLELVKNGDSYMLDIGKCMFAGGNEGVHGTIKGIDMPCPIALFISSCLAKENPLKRIYIYPSVYDEDGVTTQIDLVSPEEYEKRMNELNKIAKIEK